MRAVFATMLLVVAAFPHAAQQPDRRKLAAEVKTEFLHAWNGYKKYAWGHDDLKPLSKTYHDWYAEPLLMTPVDALDTMMLMGLKDEYASTHKYIVENLSFDKDISVQNFEITIRLLGALLTNYQLSGDKIFLNLAEDQVIDSAGFRVAYRNALSLREPQNQGSSRSQLAIQPNRTLLIEFGTLSRLTGKPIFYEKQSGPC